jgi:hypothetical protein
MMLSCDACKTRKKIVGLGNMLIDCPSCNGVGWIEIPEQELKVTLGDMMNNPKRKKKKPVEPEVYCDGA